MSAPILRHFSLAYNTVREKTSMQTKANQPKRALQRTVILIVSCLSFCGGLMLVSSLSTVEAGPIQDSDSWTDTFTDTLGISLMNNTTVDTIGERVVLTPTQIFAQTDWKGGPGITSTTTITNRYDSGMGVNTIISGEVSLGYTLATDGSRADLNRDGYLDIVFSNYCSGTTEATWQYEIDSYVYWGGPDGYTTTNRLGLPTQGASGNAVADLDEDGYLDIVFSNVGRGTGYPPILTGVSSYIYWGSSQGYSDAYSTTLPTNGATGCSVADLNDDGDLDIVFSNYATATLPYFQIDSYIYWGDGTRNYSTSRRTGLPTRGSVANYVFDLDQDGYLDIIFNNYRNNWPDEHDSAAYEMDSYIYWGSNQGYTTTNRTGLPTIGAHGSSVADLNKDDYLDIVFSNRNTGDGSSGFIYDLDSYIYWGSSTGYTVTDRTELPTMGTYGNSIADLDNDGNLDIIFSNHQSSTQTHTIDSYIYWGDGTKNYTVTRRLELPTIGAAGNTVGDLDNDGNLDIVFSNRRSTDDHNQDSYIYWGDGTRNYTTTRRMLLPTLGTIGNSTVGSPIVSANTTFGTIYAQPITSGVTITDAMTTPPIYAPTGVITSAGFSGGVGHDWKQVVWNAAIEASTNITIEVATSNDGVTWTWNVVGSSVTGTNEADLSSLSDSHYLRYRAILQSSPDHLSTPTLYDITFYGDYEPSGDATSVQITPASLSAWKAITWTADISAGQAITIQVLDGGGIPISDGDLPGNSTGFTTPTVDISPLNVSTYPSLTLKAFLATTAVTTTPALEDWSVTWFASPVSITLTPTLKVLTAGEAVTYTVTARDAHGQEWDVTSSTDFTITAGANGSWNDNVYTSGAAGTWTVTATYESLVATATLTIEHAGLDHVDLTPGSETRVAGQSISYTLTAYDAYNNPWDVTASGDYTITLGAGGEWATNVYTTEIDGTWTVTGTYSGTSDTAILYVEAAEPESQIFLPIITKSYP